MILLIKKFFINKFLNKPTYNAKVVVSKWETAQNKSLRFQNYCWVKIRKFLYVYNQEIGLEAAIFWRSRNRALVKEDNFFILQR